MHAQINNAAKAALNHNINPRFERTGDYLYYAVFPESILSPMNAAMVTKVSTKRYHEYSPAERYCANNPNRAGISRIPV